MSNNEAVFSRVFGYVVATCIARRTYILREDGTIVSPDDLVDARVSVRGTLHVDIIAFMNDHILWPLRQR